MVALSTNNTTLFAVHAHDAVPSRANGAGGISRGIVNRCVSFLDVFPTEASVVVVLDFVVYCCHELNSTTRWSMAQENMRRWYSVITSGFQLGKGGANPTTTHHNRNDFIGRLMTAFLCVLMMFVFCGFINLSSEAAVRYGK